MPEELSGTITRITYHNADTHYTVLRLDTPQGEVTVVGSFPSITPGEDVNLAGEWIFHPQYGRQFRADEERRTLPVTREGVLRYLSSGVVRGVGPAFARRLVDHFGVDTLRIIEQEPHRLTEISGLGAQRRESLIRGVAAHKAVQEIMVFLQGLGITPSLAGRIFKRYGHQAVSQIQHNPYRLADEVFGIGFRTADSIALRLGIAPDSPERARAAVRFRLQEAVQEGHLCLPLTVLTAEVTERLQVPQELGKSAVTELSAVGRLVLEGEGDTVLVYLPDLHLAERETARLLIALLKGFTQQQTFALPEVHPTNVVATSSSITLSPEQSQAVQQALSGGVTVITGGPGTGKTTILRCLLQQAQAGGRKVLLAAPTGRAAKRLQEATGAPALTIHRLLEYGFSEESGQPIFQRHAGNPLMGDMVVLDEVSMLDVPLAHHLLQAISPGTSLVLVGDADQLPSVGPGSFLRDLVNARCLPVVRLKTVFRQAEESMIVVNAHRINQGETPVYNQGDKDFFIIEESKVERFAEQIQGLVSERLPRYLGCDSNCIQVLSPVRKGPAGVQRLNQVLQRALNPRAAELGEADNETLLPGDRVMQIRNNYDKMVFNGDIGVVSSVDSESGELVVYYADRDEGPQVTYLSDEWDELSLAYASSVHKSQGSEFQVVVVALPRVMPGLMTRNLLYTAVTRARKLVVLVGEKRTVGGYIKNDTAFRRYGSFVEKLTKEAGSD